MSLSYEGNGNMVMPVGPMNGYGNGGFGFGGDGAWWLIILFLFMFNGNWGNNFGAGNAMPYMINQTNDVQRGFDQNAIMNGLTGITSAVNNGFATAAMQNCNGFNGVTAAITNGFAAAEAANNARQIADMQTAFANQTAMSNGFANLASQMASCCCENRLAVANQNAMIAAENCADRQATMDASANIMNALNAGFQSIKDQMCNDKIDAKNEEIARLNQQLLMRDLAASQTAQTAAIQAGQRNLANEVEQYVVPTPRPAYIVQNPSCCNPAGYGCGCGFAG